MDGVRNANVGRWIEAVDSTSRGAEVNDRIGHLRRREECSATLGVALNLKGDFTLAENTWQDVFVSAHERGDNQMQLWSLGGQAISALRKGEAGHANVALALLEKANRLLTEDIYAHGPDEIRAYGLLAQARLRKGEAALALQAAELATGRISAELLPNTLYSFEGYVGPPLVYLSLWEGQVNGRHEMAKEESCRELARRACKNLRRFAWVFPFAQPRSWLFQGLYAWLAGKPVKARKAWRKSLAHAEKLAMPYERGLAHYEIGRHLAATDPGREEHLKRAIEFFSQLETAWDLERARENLAKISELS
jgi:tetratricopeptide (TPR) repeat protein